MARVALRAACILLLFALATAAAVAQSTQKNPASPYIQVTLRQQLRQGLKCRRPIEFEFVDNVADLVDRGVLSVNTVNICFDWSCQRDSYRPFVYFQASLTNLAKRKGVDLTATGTVEKKKTSRFNIKPIRTDMLFTRQQ